MSLVSVQNTTNNIPNTQSTSSAGSTNLTPSQISHISNTASKKTQQTSQEVNKFKNKLSSTHFTSQEQNRTINNFITQISACIEHIKDPKNKNCPTDFSLRDPKKNKFVLPRDTQEAGWDNEANKTYYNNITTYLTGLKNTIENIHKQDPNLITSKLESMLNNSETNIQKERTEIPTLTLGIIKTIINEINEEQPSPNEQQGSASTSQDSPPKNDASNDNNEDDPKKTTPSTTNPTSSATQAPNPTPTVSQNAVDNKVDPKKTTRSTTNLTSTETQAPSTPKVSQDAVDNNKTKDKASTRPIVPPKPTLYNPPHDTKAATTNDQEDSQKSTINNIEIMLLTQTEDKDKSTKNQEELDSNNRPQNHAVQKIQSYSTPDHAKINPSQKLTVPSSEDTSDQSNIITKSNNDLVKKNLEKQEDAKKKIELERIKTTEEIEKEINELILITNSQ